MSKIKVAAEFVLSGSSEGESLHASSFVSAGFMGSCAFLDL